MHENEKKLQQQRKNPNPSPSLLPPPARALLLANSTVSREGILPRKRTLAPLANPFDPFPVLSFEVNRLPMSREIVRSSERHIAHLTTRRDERTLDRSSRIARSTAGVRASLLRRWRLRRRLSCVGLSLPFSVAEIAGRDDRARSSDRDGRRGEGGRFGEVGVVIVVAVLLCERLVEIVLRSGATRLLSLPRRA